ncbi:response regulator [Brumimicrobium glaciale]|uniref:Response regulator n=1 Tax=Brumimicrobium glaciale TaxID=200475 RepID=A0A4Q4KML2_9FLAO|nr:response regulator [Brumimicrobium glaciale]RYM33997.1 response regulator [Brumimicrobium glaciale]
MKILIIEDNRNARENITEILELANFKVYTAENGEIGLEKAKKIHPDVIICDIMMPGIDGYEVLSQLGKKSDTASIPFIFLTAKAEKTDRRKGMRLGADDYLTKPFSDTDLIEAIESRFKKHDFLKKEYSQTIEGVSQFIEAASNYLDLDHLTKNYSLKEYKKRDVIYMEGNSANFMYFIKSGALKTYKTTEKGKEFVTGLYSIGNFVGQLSLLSNNGSYIESAAVLEDVELYEIPKLNFTTLIHANKDIANKFVSLVSNNLVDVQEQLLHVAYSTVRQRLAKIILKIHSKRILTMNEGNDISITREDLAGLIGTATETAIRRLTDFKEEGLITIDHSSKIRVEDKKSLKHIALYG